MQPLKIFLDESNCKAALFPLTEIRHTADLIVGKFTIRQSWQRLAPDIILSEKQTEDSFPFPANVIPTNQNIEILLNAAKENIHFIDNALVPVLKHPSDVFHSFKELLLDDIQTTIEEREEEFIEIEPFVFAHPTAIVKNVFFDTEHGPILIDKNAVISHGAMLSGPIYIGEKTLVKMGAILYGPLSIAKQCTLGGEINNSIFYEFANKGHDGYIGTSIIGSWCNLGAGTSCSNVKNTAATISYKMLDGTSYNTLTVKGGLLMGDYSRTAINTSFNTAAVVGLSCNIFGSNSNKKIFESFTWGQEKYKLNKAIEHLENWKKLKNEEISTEEIELIKKIYNKIL